jgi:hypothetical protein
LTLTPEQEAARKLAVRQTLWLLGREAAQPGRWWHARGFAFRYGRDARMIISEACEWTPAQRQEFGRFQGGLYSAANGARLGQRGKYDETVERAIAKAHKQHPRWGARPLTEHLQEKGVDVKRWKVEQWLSRNHGGRPEGGRRGA